MSNAMSKSGGDSAWGALLDHEREPVHKTRIMMVDDHPIVREGMAQFLNAQPDLLLCRCEHPLPDNERAKIALFCNVRKEAVIPALDANSIYAVPLQYHAEGLDRAPYPGELGQRIFSSIHPALHSACGQPDDLAGPVQAGASDASFGDQLQHGGALCEGAHVSSPCDFRTKAWNFF